MKSLEELYLVYNMGLTSADADIISSISTLRVLNMGHCSLTDLPSRYFYYKWCLVFDQVVLLVPQSYIYIIDYRGYSLT